MLRGTLCSKIKRPKGLLLFLNGMPIVGKIFRHVDKEETEAFLQGKGIRLVLFSCFETQGRRKVWKSGASTNTVGIICPLVEIGLLYSLKYGWGHGPSAPSVPAAFETTRMNSSWFPAWPLLSSMRSGSSILGLLYDICTTLEKWRHRIIFQKDIEGFPYWIQLYIDRFPYGTRNVRNWICFL